MNQSHIINPYIREPTTPEKLCEGKFKVLEKYLSIFDSTDDIKLLKEKEIINLAEGQSHRILMKLFMKKVLEPYLRDVSKIKKSNLTLKDRVISSKYQNKRINKIDMKLVPQQYWGFLKGDDCENSIYLSYNHLSDCDIKYVKQLIESAPPNVKVLDLSNNDFEGKEDFEETLLSILDRVKWLDISHTPFARNLTLDSALLPKILDKLIFIPYEMLESDSYNEAVKNTHKNYYEYVDRIY
jgi:hypothetical protein